MRAHRVWRCLLLGMEQQWSGRRRHHDRPLNPNQSHRSAMNSALKVLAIAVIGFGCNQPSLGPDAGYCPDPNSGFTQCGASCCDDGSEQCTSAEASMCCPFAQLCANGAQCCNSTEQCLGPTGPTVTSGICCPSTSSIACNGTCCGAGQACIGTTCCDNMCQTLSGPVCCTGGSVCGTGTGGSAACVCDAPNTACGAQCCSSVQTCDAGICSP